MTEMNQLMESFRGFLKEDIYDKETREFIRIAKKVENKFANDRDMNKYEVAVETLRVLLLWLERSGFEELGSGVQRIGYLTPSGHIIKIAKTPGSISANRREVNMFLKNNTGIFPRVEEYSKAFYWLILEKVHILGDLKAAGFRSNPEDKQKAKVIIDKNFPKMIHLFELAGVSFSYNWDTMQRVIEDIAKRTESGSKGGFGQDPEAGLFDVIRLTRKLEGNSEPISKELVNKIYAYYDHPDAFVVNLIEGVKKAGIRLESLDAHKGNVGYRDDGTLVVLDPIFG